MPTTTGNVLATFAAVALLAAAASPARADEACPAADATNGYLTMPLHADRPQDPGEMQLYYHLLKPFDPAKKTLLVVNGGPGGDYRLVDDFKAVADELDLNVLSFDHRGLGCTHVTSRVDWFDYEPRRNAIRRAAADLHALHDHLVGEGGKWFVYGVSYGSMLGQRYAIDFPKDVEALVLDSTFFKTAALGVARGQYKSFYIEHDPATQAKYAAVVARYPDAADAILRKMWGLTYSFRGRTVEIPTLLQQVLDAATPEAARELYDEPVYHGPTQGMTYDIICEEIWDYRPDAARDAYYFADFAANCGPYASTRTPMDWTEELRHLPVRTYIWAGAFDPVTPAAVMREMHELVPGSLLWENPLAGHGLFFEKNACARKLMGLFFAGTTTDVLDRLAASDACQSAPEDGDAKKVDWNRLTTTGRAAF
jgi:pimeloyl-ACP methyl ester carboxylesterase